MLDVVLPQWCSGREMMCQALALVAVEMDCIIGGQTAVCLVILISSLVMPSYGQRCMKCQSMGSHGLERMCKGFATFVCPLPCRVPETERAHAGQTSDQVLFRSTSMKGRNCKGAVLCLITKPRDGIGNSEVLERMQMAMGGDVCGPCVVHAVFVLDWTSDQHLTHDKLEGME